MKQIFIFTIAFLMCKQSESQSILKTLSKGKPTSYQFQLAAKSASNAKKTRTQERRMIALYFEKSTPTHSLADSLTYTYNATRGTATIFSSDYLNIPYIFQNFDIYPYYSNSSDQTTELFRSQNNAIIPILTPADSSNLSINTYDASNYLTQRINYAWNGSTMEFSDKFAIQYDANHNVIEELYQYWNGSSWVANSKYSYTYINSKVSTIISELYNGTAWYPGSKNLFQYDANGNLIEQEDMWGWSISASEYTYKQKVNYSYTPSVITWVEADWIVATSSYRNKQKGIANVINTNQILNAQTYLWDTVLNVFDSIPAVKDSIWYNANNKIIKSTSNNIVVLDCIRDANDRITKIEYFEAPGHYHRNELVYDSYDYIVNDKQYEFDTITNTWGPLYSEQKYYYESYDNGIAQGVEEVKDIRNAKIFPNPASINSYITYYTKVNKSTSIIVSDIFGHTIKTIEEEASIGDHLIEIPMNQLQSGMYFVQVIMNNQIMHTLKLLKK